MTSPTKRCKIHYRKLTRQGANLPDSSLSSLLKLALHHLVEGITVKDDVRLRTAPNNASNFAQRLINDFHVGDGFVFGNTCSFTPGQMQALLRTTGDGSSHGDLSEALEAYDIREARANDGHEYVGEICYWLAIDDHFYQIQHTSIQVKQMEEYLNWLLLEQTKLITTDASVRLESKFDIDQVGSNFDDISSIEIGGIAPETSHLPFSAEVGDTPIEDIESTEAVGFGTAQFEKAKDVLNALLGPAGTASILERVPEEASLEVKVNIGYKSKKRKLNKEFLGDIVQGLRNLPDGDIRIRGKNMEIKGSDARLSQDMTIKRVSADSSLLDLENTMKQMLEVHRRFVHDGKV